MLGLNALYGVQIGHHKTFLERDAAYRIDHKAIRFYGLVQTHVVCALQTLRLKLELFNLWI